MPTVPADDLRRLSADLLQAVGARADDARLVADALIEANLTGHDSHGIIRLLNYCEWCGLGTIDPAARPKLLSQRGGTAVIDGGWGWGMVAMTLAVETAIGLAREHGVAAVTVRRSNHIGRVAPYVIRLAEEGMVGITTTNANPAVVAYGGRSRIFGTNPIAWAAPRGEGRSPLVHDIATAGVAEGKLRVARAKGVSVAPGLIVNADGQPTVDPEDFYAGGALLPFGGHKGSGLSALVQVLGHGLAGADSENLAAHRGGNGPVLLALDASFFGPLVETMAATDAVATTIRRSLPAPGFDEVLLPGQVEEQTRLQRSVDGVPVADRTWDELCRLAEQWGVSI